MDCGGFVLFEIGSHCVDQAALELTEICMPLSACVMLVLQGYANIPSPGYNFNKNFKNNIYRRWTLSIEYIFGDTIKTNILLLLSLF